MNLGLGPTRMLACPPETSRSTTTRRFHATARNGRPSPSLNLDLESRILCHRPCPSPLPASNTHRRLHHPDRLPTPHHTPHPHLDHGASSNPTSPLPARAPSFSTSSVSPYSCSTAKRTSIEIQVPCSLTRVGHMSDRIVCGGAGRRTCFGVRG